jgi:hypothetical protein
MKSQRFPQICKRFVFRGALACHVDFQTLRNYPVTFFRKTRSQRSFHHYTSDQIRVDPLNPSNPRTYYFL